MQNPRINLTLTAELGKRLNDYCLKVIKRNGSIPPRLQQKIARAALEEWLNKYENNLDIDFSS